MDKIVGFTIAKSKIGHGDIDVFNRGLKLLELKKCGLYVYLWGINDIAACHIDGKYVLSFPAGESLFDRNVVIHFSKEAVVVENDWLGSIPVFYNQKETIISTLCLKALKGREIHPEGLSNFVEFGYSILEQTPFKEVKFMRYFSRLTAGRQGIAVTYKEDPVLKDGLLDKAGGEGEVFAKIKNYVNRGEKATADEIVVPTSGGYDSRLLDFCVEDKSRIRSFTYGISDNQSRSTEVVYARKVAEILGIQWEQIELGGFHQYIKEWFKIYGVSTHLHGMYHIEFYNKILKRHSFGPGATFLSGIFGDVWGGLAAGKIKNYNEIVKLAYAHGANADKNQLKLQHNSSLRKKFFAENQQHLENDKIRIVFLIRLKIILISYLNTIPEYFGFPVWSPFLNFDIALSMLNIPPQRRQKRVWEQDLFKRHNLDVENTTRPQDVRNTLNYQAYRKHRFEPLDISIGEKYFNKNYLAQINKTMRDKPSWLQEILTGIDDKLFKVKGIGSVLRRLGFKPRKHKDILIVFPYYLAKTIEMGLTSRKTAD